MFDVGRSQFPISARRKNSVLTELVKKPCSDSHVTATQHFINLLRVKTDACDGDTDTFYHSIEEPQERNPNLTLSLNGTFVIKTITVVNVHTGGFCESDDEKAKICTKRISGAKVEVVAGLYPYHFLQYCINVMGTVKFCSRQ